MKTSRTRSTIIKTPTTTKEPAPHNRPHPPVTKTEPRILEEHKHKQSQRNLIRHSSSTTISLLDPNLINKMSDAEKAPNPQIISLPKSTKTHPLRQPRSNDTVDTTTGQQILLKDPQKYLITANCDISTHKQIIPPPPSIIINNTTICNTHVCWLS